MPANVFISFAVENLKQVHSIRALAKDPQHALEFHDWSESEPVKDKAGTPLPYPPDDPRAAPIRKELKRLTKKVTKIVVIIGETTHASKWVNWEIQTFYEQHKATGDAIRRIRGMYVKGREDVDLPKRLKRLNVKNMEWDLSALNKWFDVNPNSK